MRFDSQTITGGSAQDVAISGLDPVTIYSIRLVAPVLSDDATITIKVDSDSGETLYDSVYVYTFKDNKIPIPAMTANGTILGKRCSLLRVTISESGTHKISVEYNDQ